MAHLQMTSMAASLLTGFVMLTCTPAHAENPQSADLRFDAASLKPAAPVGPPLRVAPSGEEIISEKVVQTTPEGSANRGGASPGRLHYVATLREFLANAYDVKEFQIDSPAWMDTERFALDATMPPETTREQRISMLKNLLTDRFKLTTHRGTRELSVYVLVAARNGPKMTESSDMPAGPPATTVRTASAGTRVRITAQAATIVDLAKQLTLQVDRPVRDQTGIQKRFDFVLAFAHDQLNAPTSPLGAASATPLSDSASSLPDAQDLPDLFSAIQSQLGLRLEAKRAPVELIVIDHVEKTPAEN